MINEEKIKELLDRCDRQSFLIGILYSLASYSDIQTREIIENMINDLYYKKEDKND